MKNPPLDSIHSISTMLIASSTRWRNFRRWASPPKLDLHVAHLAKTRPRHDRLAVVVSTQMRKLNSYPKSRPRATIRQAFRGRFDKGVVLCFTNRQCDGRLRAPPVLHRPAVNRNHASTGRMFGIIDMQPIGTVQNASILKRQIFGVCKPPKTR